MKAYLTRVGALIILMLALVWLCRAPDWEPLIAFVVALTGFLGYDFWHSFHGVSKHDEKLIERFHSLFSEESGTVPFLRDHDMAIPFHHSKLTPVFTVNDTWHGIEFEFDDKQIEKAKKEFQKKVREYVSLVVIETYPHNQNPSLNTMDFKDFANPPEKIEIRDRMNELGTQVYDEYEKFVRVIRQKTRKAEQA